MNESIFKTLLGMAVAFLKGKAAATPTKLDDYLVLTLESLSNSDPWIKATVGLVSGGQLTFAEVLAPFGVKPSFPHGAGAGQAIDPAKCTFTKV